jgi:hypothetical protein
MAAAVESEMPVRVQRKRARGWRKPDGAVSVTRPGKWGNPFIPGFDNPLIPGRVVEDKRHAYLLFAAHAPLNEKLVEAAKSELRGKNLMCFCPVVFDGEYHPCHADVLLALANDLTVGQVKDENIRRTTCRIS